MVLASCSLHALTRKVHATAPETPVFWHFPLANLSQAMFLFVGLYTICVLKVFVFANN